MVRWSRLAQFLCFRPSPILWPQIVENPLLVPLSLISQLADAGKCRGLTISSGEMAVSMDENLGHCTMTRPLRARMMQESITWFYFGCSSQLSSAQLSISLTCCSTRHSELSSSMAQHPWSDSVSYAQHLDWRLHIYFCPLHNFLSWILPKSYLYPIHWVLGRFGEIDFSDLFRSGLFSLGTKRCPRDRKVFIMD
jgi:hypothetical protein